MMTFEEWRATRKIMQVEEAAELLGLDADMFEYSARVYLYAGQSYLEEDISGRFFVMLGRDDFWGSLRQVEHHLFFHWVVSECLDWDCDIACDWLDTFCAFYDYPDNLSAEELVHELLSIDPSERDFQTRLNIGWLGWFCEQWEGAEAVFAAAE